MPASGEIMYPAPTTCATSWIVPPRNTPAARVHITANTITGSSIATRISLTRVAMSPVSFDML